MVLPFLFFALFHVVQGQCLWRYLTEVRDGVYSSYTTGVIEGSKASWDVTPWVFPICTNGWVISNGNMRFRFEFILDYPQMKCVGTRCSCGSVQILDSDRKTTLASVCIGDNDRMPYGASTTGAGGFIFYTPGVEEWGFKIRFFPVGPPLEACPKLSPFDTYQDYCNGATSSCYCMTDCDGESFFCPQTAQCRPRCHRCDPAACNEDQGVCKIGADKGYPVYVGQLPMGPMGTKPPTPTFLCGTDGFYHMYVVYRGFAYEFGSAYLYAERDITDPRYRYRQGCYKYLKEPRLDGFSTCTRDKILTFIESYKKQHPAYGFCTHNCQHFGNALRGFLFSCSGGSPLRAGVSQGGNVTAVCDSDKPARDCASICREHEGFVKNSKGDYVCSCVQFSPTIAKSNAASQLLSSNLATCRSFFMTASFLLFVANDLANNV